MASASAQSAVTVPVGDPLYQDVDRLVDAGLIARIVVGQRPYSRGALARFAAEARSRLDSTSDGTGIAVLQEALARLERRLVHATSVDSAKGATSRVIVAPFDVVRFDALSTDAASRPVPSNGLGSMEADLNSLTSYREGREYPMGSTFGLESQHWLQVGSVSIQAQPRIALSLPREGATAGAFQVESGDLRGVMGNVALTVGREFTLWSQADDAGLLFSENAPALDMIRLASDNPFQLPGAFRHAGLVAATLQIADLGSSAANAHSRLVSYKVSVRPTDVLELGATFENHFGGAGSRSPSLLNRVIDLLPFVDIFRHHADSTDVQSDKLIGADGRLRLPMLANATLFGEVALEDFDFHRLGSIFTQDAAYSAGVSVPAIFSPSFSGRVRYHTTGLRFYEHHLIVDGIAAHRFILGDDLGHDARAFDASLTWRTAPGLLLTISADHEIRSNDEYLGSYINPNLTGLVFQKVSDRPEEVRTRGLLALRYTPPTGHATVELGGGAERTSNFGFAAVPSRIHGVGNLTITAYR